MNDMDLEVDARNESMTELSDDELDATVGGADDGSGSNNINGQIDDNGNN
ncbi:MAG: hypothetical protein U0235_03325 [Polyangiaceae bacterium]